MIFEAKLPPKPGYIERVNPTTGEHFYHKVGLLKGYSHETVIINRSQSYELPRDVKFASIIVTCIGAGGSKSAGTDGACGEIVTKHIHINKYLGKSVNVSIGSAGSNGACGTPTAFGEFVCANGGMSGVEYKTAGYNVDGVIYGLGETDDHKATDGLCIIEYDMPLYGA